ncbi:MAG: penicillin-binding protein 2 [Bacteroidia bacterium]|nr:penicillin-binding protein 2 [Bacteroidia bacterium]
MIDSSTKKITLYIIFISVGFIFLLRLFWLQVVDDTYVRFARNNVLNEEVVYPARGLVYDRDGKLLVYNDAIYDLMVVPERLKKLDTAGFCEVLGITREDFDKRFERIKKSKGYSKYRAVIFEKQLTIPVYAAFQEKLYDFTGFYVQTRTDRKYVYKSAAHVMGYIGEVTDKIIEQSKGYYRMGDYFGVNGIERSYENELRGTRGIKYVLVDVHNRAQGRYKDGLFDTASVAGLNVTTTLDHDLQEYGEKLIANKRGSIVAIEPSTGEILAIVSFPTYDPNLFIGRERGNNYMKLLRDPMKPLFNRPIAAPYPPGSIFKISMSLVGQQEGVLNPNTTYGCARGASFGSVHVGCHPHPSPLPLQPGIAVSCNAYFCNVYRSVIDNRRYPTTEAAFDQWRKHVLSFGLGQRLGIDLPGEGTGNVPTSAYYSKIYGQGHWKASTTISLGIGQGELGITPLQMANVTAILANRGYYITPHIVKAIAGKKLNNPIFTEKHFTTVDTSYYGVVIDAMQDVVERGTATIARLKNIVVCGKTGTAQNPHGKDHSVFFAFAPRENPKIAIAVVIENAGFGATYAAPIASLMIEQYLTDTITRLWMEERLVNTDLIHQPATNETTTGKPAHTTH